ncbi:MAG: hypothetical protein QOK39_116 [Acidimicrobiaceae bacterium]|jgi:hypothetical protein|nr:hypothetical protein [Acidimicrobiaceae bacterium]
MALPALGCRVAWASNPFDSSPIWTEVGTANGGAGDVRKAKTKRGRQRLLRSTAQFQAGTLELVLANLYRDYDPTNTAGRYWPNMQPEKLVQVYATYLGVEYKLWTGYIDDLPQVWPGFAEASVALVATDLFKSLAIKRLGSAGYRNAVIADGAVGYWRLGDPPGSPVAVDSSGNGRSAGVFGGPVFGAAGGLVPTDNDGALTINNPSSGIAAISPLPGNAAGFSIEFLIKNSVALGSGVLQLFAEPYGVIYGTQAIQIVADNNGVTSYVSGHNAGGLSQFGWADGIWHHCVLTVSPTLALTYVDGVHAFGAALSGLPALAAVEAFVFGNAGVYAGGIDTAATTAVDELALYPYPLTAAQVANHYKLASWPAQMTGARVNQILDTINHPASQRRVDTGRTLCAQDTTDETQVKALSLLQKCEQTEQGQFFIASDGFVVFQDRYHRFISPNATSQATFGDGGAGFPSEIPYTLGGLAVGFDRAELFNNVPVTRRGGQVQTAIDTASVAAFTDRTMAGLADLLMATDQDALYCAQWIVADTKSPQFQVSDLVLNPLLDSRLWPLVLGLDIGAVVTINKHNVPGAGPNLISAADSDFEGGSVGNWVGINTTLAVNAVHAHTGTQALQVTPTSTSGPFAKLNTAITVAPLTRYMLDAWVLVTDASESAQIVVQWFTAGSVFISSSTLPAAALTAGVFGEVAPPGANIVTSPAGAAQAIIFVSPNVANLHPLWVDTVAFRLAQVLQATPPLSLVCRIEGIEHDVAAPNTWITTWHLSLMGTQPWLLLDDPVAGLLDHGNRLGW